MDFMAREQGGRSVGFLDILFGLMAGTLLGAVLGGVCAWPLARMTADEASRRGGCSDAGFGPLVLGVLFGALVGGFVGVKVAGRSRGGDPPAVA